jgi:uncharacterized membrane protein YphA (DoxX/SURF4 family)
MTSKTVGYWLATPLVALAFVAPGIGNLVHAPQIAHDMAHLGYPSYFLTVLGAWKILGAIAITIPGFPRLKEWAYAGMMFDLTGAAISRAVSGDGLGGIVPPLAIAALTITSWALRPQSRRLDPGAPGLRRWGPDTHVSGA